MFWPENDFESRFSTKNELKKRIFTSKYNILKYLIFDTFSFTKAATSKVSEALKSSTQRTSLTDT